MDDRLRKGTTEQSDYLSYLLRLWRVSGGGEPIWRASLESSLTGERQGFANLDDLFDFLREQTGAVSDANGGQNEAERGVMNRRQNTIFKRA